MIQATNQCVTSIFYYVCLLAAFATTFWCIFEFAKNEDVSVISYQAFDSKNPENQYPSLSVCFLDPYKNSSLSSYNDEGINVTAYADFLGGKYWNDRMMHIDYDSVTIDIKDYIIGACVTTLKSSNKCHELNNIEPITLPTVFGIQKCFSFQHQAETPLNEVFIALNNSVFPSGERPEIAGFQFMWHYPYQVIRSTALPRFHRWPSRSANGSYYVMDFYLTNVEILKRRRTGAKACSVSERYDFESIEDVINSVGCKPPFWKSNKVYPNCSSRNQLLNIRSHFKEKMVEGNSYQEYVSPCIEIKKMDVRYKETGGNERKHEFTVNIYENFEKEAKTMDGWFIINIHFWKLLNFKETKQIRAYSMQSLIGNAGGYIGLLVGITISQLPNFLFTVYRKSYFTRNPKKNCLC